MPRLFLLMSKLLLLALLLCAVPGTLVGQNAAQATATQPEDALPADTPSTTCFSTFASGSGPTYFKWCVTRNGNIVSLESPKGVEHIRGHHIQEGYGLCDFFPITPLYYWDFAGGGSSGWNPSVIVQPNGPNTFPLTIKRTTTDGFYELDQAFSQKTDERSIVITMQVFETGCIGTCGAGTFVSRYANIDADNTNINDFDQGKESAWGYNSGSAGVMLSASPVPSSYYTNRAYFDGAGAYPLSQGPPTQCNGGNTAGPFQGDGVVWVYQFFQQNVLSPGTVRFEYKRF